MAQIIFNLKRIHVGVGSGEYGKYYHHLVISDFQGRRRRSLMQNVAVYVVYVPVEEFLSMQKLYVYKY